MAENVQWKPAIRELHQVVVSQIAEALTGKVLGPRRRGNEVFMKSDEALNNGQRRMKVYKLSISSEASSE